LLKECCALFGIERSGSRDELIARLVEFLSKPSEIKAAGTKVSGKRKRKAKKAGKKKGKKTKKGGMKEKSSKAPNAYIVFSKTKFPELKAENPQSSIAEIASMLGKIWNEMSVEEKAVRTAFLSENDALCPFVRHFRKYLGVDDKGCRCS